MQLSSRHLRVLVPTAVTAGRLGCPGRSQRADRWAAGRALPIQQPPTERECLPGEEGKPALSSRGVILLRMGKEGESNKLLSDQTLVPVTLRGPPGICHIRRPRVSLPLYHRRFLSVSVGASLSFCLSLAVRVALSCALTLVSAALPARSPTGRSALSSPARWARTREVYLPRAGFPGARGSACGPRTSSIHWCLGAFGHPAVASPQQRTV